MHVITEAAMVAIYAKLDVASFYKKKSLAIC